MCEGSLTEVILEFFKWNIHRLSKKEKIRKKDVNKMLNQNWFIFLDKLSDDLR